MSDDGTGYGVSTIRGVPPALEAEMKEMLAAEYERGRLAGRAEERAAIVQWLRDTPNFCNFDPDIRIRIDDDAALIAADAIERGDGSGAKS